MDIETEKRFALMIDTLMYDALAKISDDERCQCETGLDGSSITKMCPRCRANTTLRVVDAALRKAKNGSSTAS